MRHVPTFLTKNNIHSLNKFENNKKSYEFTFLKESPLTVEKGISYEFTFLKLRASNFQYLKNGKSWLKTKSVEKSRDLELITTG